MITNIRVAENTDNLRAIEAALSVYVLMAMNKPSRPRSRNITVECRKAVMHFILFVVNEPGGIMGNKNIDRWKP